MILDDDAVKTLTRSLGYRLTFNAFNRLIGFVEGILYGVNNELNDIDGVDCNDYPLLNITEVFKDERMVSLQSLRHAEEAIEWTIQAGKAFLSIKVSDDDAQCGDSQTNMVVSRKDVEMILKNTNMISNWFRPVRAMMSKQVETDDFITEQRDIYEDSCSDRETEELKAEIDRLKRIIEIILNKQSGRP